MLRHYNLVCFLQFGRAILINENIIETCHSVRKRASVDNWGYAAGSQRKIPAGIRGGGIESKSNLKTNITLFQRHAAGILQYDIQLNSISLFRLHSCCRKANGVLRRRLRACVIVVDAEKLARIGRDAPPIWRIESGQCKSKAFVPSVVIVLARCNGKGCACGAPRNPNRRVETDVGKAGRVRGGRINGDSEFFIRRQRHRIAQLQVKRNRLPFRNRCGRRLVGIEGDSVLMRGNGEFMREVGSGAGGKRCGRHQGDGEYLVVLGNIIRHQRNSEDFDLLVPIDISVFVGIGAHKDNFAVKRKVVGNRRGEARAGIVLSGNLDRESDVLSRSGIKLNGKRIALRAWQPVRRVISKADGSNSDSGDVGDLDIEHAAWGHAPAGWLRDGGNRNRYGLILGVVVHGDGKREARGPRSGRH